MQDENNNNNHAPVITDDQTVVSPVQDESPVASSQPANETPNEEKQSQQEEIVVQETERADRDERAESQEAYSTLPVTDETETKTEDIDSVAKDETPDNPLNPTISSQLSDFDQSSVTDNPNAKWYVIHTYSGHENKVATAIKQRVESEHLEHKILDILVPTQDKIEIRGGKKGTVKEKIFPGYILVKMELDDNTWLAVRTTQGVTSFVGVGNKPTPIPEQEVRTIVKFMTQEAAPTFKDVFMVNDTIKIIDGPFAEFIGKVDSVDKERGKVRVLVSIFGRETPVELDFLQVAKL